MMGRKKKQKPDDRENENTDLEKFTEEDIAFLQEYQEMTEDFN